MPDYSARLSFGDPLHGLVDRPKLLVLGDLLDHPVLVSLEDHEVLDEVEQVLFGADSEEEDVLIWERGRLCNSSLLDSILVRG